MGDTINFRGQNCIYSSKTSLKNFNSVFCHLGEEERARFKKMEKRKKKPRKIKEKGKKTRKKTKNKRKNLIGVQSVEKNRKTKEKGKKKQRKKSKKKRKNAVKSGLVGMKGYLQIIYQVKIFFVVLRRF